jgi:hypothetical protein
MRLLPQLGFAALAAAWLLPACNSPIASDPAGHTTCVGGVCPNGAATASSSATTSTGSGGAGGGPTCIIDPDHQANQPNCDFGKVSMKTGEFPCDIEKILGKTTDAMGGCRRCHQEPAVNGAPFSLVKYEDSQNCTAASCQGGLYGAKTIFWRMALNTKTKFMPLGGPPLDDDAIQALQDWACACAPPRAPGEKCQ